MARHSTFDWPSVKEAHPELRGDNYSRINTHEIFTVLMQTMDRQTIIMQRVHHVLVDSFH